MHGLTSDYLPDISTNSAAESAVAPLQNISIEITNFSHENHKQWNSKERVENGENLKAKLLKDKNQEEPATLAPSVCGEMCPYPTVVMMVTVNRRALVKLQS